MKYGKGSWQFWLFVIAAWFMWPLTATVMWLFNPGRVAFYTKRFITGEW